MKRSGFPKRTKPLRRTKSGGPDIVREPKPMAARPVTAQEDKFLRDAIVRSSALVSKGRLVTYGGTTSGVPVKKDAPVQSEPYMRAVRDLGYCMLCGRACRPQFCHADFGKALGLKTDCRLGWPGCGPGEWGPGCHWILGTSGHYTKEERRVIEKRLGRKTRAAVKAAGTWPPHLADYTETP